MSKADDGSIAFVQGHAPVLGRSAESRPPRPSWLREIQSGGIGAVATLAVVLTLGLLSFAPLGEAAAPYGVTAAFVSVTIGATVFALLGRSAMPVGGPSSATALIFAALMAQLASDPALDLGSRAGLETVISVATATVVLMGAIQIGLAVLSLGRLAKYVPRPVLAGFMNGVAVLIVLSQLPALLGVSADDFKRGLVLEHAQPLALAVGLVTAGSTWLVARRWPRLPAALIGLAAGVALYAAIRTRRPDLPAGEVVGALPDGLPTSDLMRRLFDPETASFAWRHAQQLFTSAFILALISSLESVLGALAIDQQLDARHHTGRELLALGAANIASGLFGGVPLVLLRARALATLRAGGKGRRAALAGALCFALMYAIGGSVLAALPKAALAGIMLTIAVVLADQWTHQLISQVRAGERSADAWQSLSVIAIVFGLTVWQGFVVGVAAGVLASLLIFIRSMNRSLVRARFTAAVRPSRRIYPSAEEHFLHGARRRIQVLELEGALFFGSADRLANEADGMQADCRFLVVDFRRVSTIDESGAVLLQQLSRRLQRRGITLLMAGVTDANGHGRRLRAFGCFRERPRDDWFADVDHATEAAEQALLAEAGTAWAEVRVQLKACTLFRGLDDRSVARVREHLEARWLRAGEPLFQQGDPGDRLYVLTRGSLTIVAAAAKGAMRQRFVSFSPGVMFGETAMLDGGGRSASAVADTEVEVFVLTQESLADIARSDPDIGVQLYRNIAIHLSERLRHATSLQDVAD